MPLSFFFCSRFRDYKECINLPRLFTRRNCHKFYYSRHRKQLTWVGVRHCNREVICPERKKIVYWEKGEYHLNKKRGVDLRQSPVGYEWKKYSWLI